jgi:hypothetical protein
MSGGTAFRDAVNQHHLKNEVNSLTYGCGHHNAQKPPSHACHRCPGSGTSISRAKENFIFDYENGSCIVRQ